MSAKDGVIENKIWYTTAQTNVIVENVLLCIEPSSESLILGFWVVGPCICK